MKANARHPVRGLSIAAILLILLNVQRDFAGERCLFCKGSSICNVCTENLSKRTSVGMSPMQWNRKMRMVRWQRKDIPVNDEV